MAIAVSLREQIINERRQREKYLQSGSTGAQMYLMELVKQGQGQEALENLIFFTSPGDFIPCMEGLRRQMKVSFKTGNEYLQKRCISFLANATLSLCSFLPRWNLQDAGRHGQASLTEAQVAIEADKNQALATELAAQAPAAAEELLAEWRAETTARFEAEQTSNRRDEAPPRREQAKLLIGNSVGEYLTNLSHELTRSNLRRISEMRIAGQTLTEVSNDYAAFLQYALYLGASFVTCNPPLVDQAWVADPERWNPIVDSIIADNPDASGDALARLVTMEIVLANMRLLRPIFLLTAGRMGCVCLQVNPHRHADAPAMISEALFLYKKMRARLEDGVPNVVFKLPGTRAGLEACRALTGKGIGTTITVNFGIFQHLPFAQAIHEGQAIFSCLVQMSGRLAYPVRDELLARLDQLVVYGIDEARAREAAAWSGIIVLKRLYRLLTERGYDLSQVKPLVASLRIYEGDGYDNLPSAFPDITETLGASIISIFPNIRQSFDMQSGIKLDPRCIESPVPDDILETLTHSQIFKQAYYVDDQDWLPDEDERFRPDYKLSLGDEGATAAWVPVYNTLTEFCNSYDRFVQRILERKHLLHNQ